jgi:hypothetical protein
MSDLFFSYSSQDHEIVHEMAQALEQVGYTTYCFRRHGVIGEKYAKREMEEISGCRAVFLFVSRHSVKSSEVEPEVNTALARKKPIIPLLVNIGEEEVAAAAPSWLLYFSKVTWARLSSVDEAKALVGKLVSGLIKEGIAPLNAPSQAPNQPTPGAAAAEVAANNTPTIGDSGKASLLPGPTRRNKVYLDLLHNPGPAPFGRDNAVGALDEAWQSPRTQIVTLIGEGGIGKTALIQRWLAGMAADHYRGADRVYAWCFYDPEGKNVPAPAEPFFHHALPWFGDNDVSGPHRARGARLADRMPGQRTLMILDGLEAMQDAAGKLQDEAMQAFLLALAQQNPGGLCVASSRLPLADLEVFHGQTVTPIELPPLSADDGVRLLRTLVKSGSDAELKEAAAAYGGNPLALTLLAGLLAGEFRGSHWKEVPLEQDQRVARLMASYDRICAGVERDLLRMLALFDGPADEDCLWALRKTKIGGLTDHVAKIERRAWNNAIYRLRKLRLIAEENAKQPKVLAVQPLVRRHYARHLQSEHRKGWQKAHRWLFDYLNENTKPEQPDALHQMMPLFEAVTHACRAGRHQEGWEVYWRRIRRGKDGFSALKLYAQGTDLEVLRNFFETPWDNPVAKLDAKVRAGVMSEAAFDLRLMGRLHEAVPPLEAGLDLHDALDDWESAAEDAGNLCEILLLLGDLDRADAFGRRGIAIAEKVGANCVAEDQATWAHVLFRKGDPRAAEVYNHADQACRAGDRLHTVMLVAHFTDFLLATGRVEDALNRARATVGDSDLRAEPEHHQGLAHLALARAMLFAERTAGAGVLAGAQSHLDQAFEHLRAAGFPELLLRWLLVAAELHLETDPAAAAVDLQKAIQIAARDGMQLYLADAERLLAESQKR